MALLKYAYFHIQKPPLQCFLCELYQLNTCKFSFIIRTILHLETIFSLNARQPFSTVVFPFHNSWCFQATEKNTSSNSLITYQSKSRATILHPIARTAQNKPKYNSIYLGNFTPNTDTVASVTLKHRQSKHTTHKLQTQFCTTVNVGQHCQGRGKKLSTLDALQQY